MATDLERGIDKRSLYTRSLIKGSLLELLNTHSFTSISVKLLAEHAGIGRNTFYRHFNNTFEVLEAAIDDALHEALDICRYIGFEANAPLANLAAPFCEFFHSSKRYRVLFADVDLSSLVIGRMVALDNGLLPQALQASQGCSPKQAEALTRFQAAGILEICSAYAHANDEDWLAVLQALDQRL